ATKLYCFVHKVPVCGECICFPEHQICVIRTYSEWVIDGEYDWPPKCCKCQVDLEEGTGSQTTRLGCLHVIHTNCLVSHIKSFPPHTAPAGYVCPSCSTPTGMEKNIFGNHPVSLSVTESRGPPPAFASDPLIGRENHGNSDSVDGYSPATGSEPSKLSVTDIMEPGATTRKGPVYVERQNSEISYYADDEDTNRKKYAKRGPFRHKFLRALLPFWSSALPTLPVTAPPRKDATNAAEASEGRARHQRSSRMDPRKILLLIAIMACMATMGILYYRLVQRGPGEELSNDEQI
ncbi:hypothetical protein TanjilG_19534, partial [Lupinus angustifolius]